MNVKSPTLSGQTPCKSILPSGESRRDLCKILSEKWESRPPKSRRDSPQEAEPRGPKSRQEISPSSRWDSWSEAKPRRPKSRRDPGGNPAKIPPGFTAGSENSAAKISAGDPASAIGAKRNPGGQNLGGISVVIPPRSRRDSGRGTEIPAAKISAGPGGNPGGIPSRSRQDPGGFFTRYGTEANNCLKACVPSASVGTKWPRTAGVSSCSKWHCKCDQDAVGCCDAQDR